jgi:hypothetical protein
MKRILRSLALGVAVTLGGVHTQFVALMLPGTAVSGLGFGAVFSGTLRTVLPLAKADERAGLLSAFYLEGYLAFSLPAVLTGFLAPIVGLPLAADVYGTAVILMAVASTTCARRVGTIRELAFLVLQSIAREACIVWRPQEPSSLTPRR